VPAKGEKPEPRFVSWGTVEGMSSVTWVVDDRVAHESVTDIGGPGETAETRASGFTKFAGAGNSQIGRFKELKCDLKDMIFDFELSDLRVIRSEPDGAPKHLILTGEYHSVTPATKMRQDIVYPVEESRSFGFLPEATGLLMSQLQSRKLELVEGRISFTASHAVTQLPRFPSHPGSNPGGSEKLNGGTTAGGPALELSLTITISPSPPSTAKLVLKPLEYDEWRPKCSESEEVKGNDLGVEWRVEEAGGDPARPTKASRVVFSLLNTSKEPGVCTNWPLRPKTPADFDLRFAGAEAPPRSGYEVRDKGQNLILTDGEAGANRGAVKVECFDAGATGTLVAEAMLADGRVLKATVEKSGDAQLMIPDFQPGVSGIAHCWRKEYAPGKTDDADDETSPKGDGQPGDGLTVWEEYRGFWVNGAWMGDCDPRVKDLFVFNGIGGEAHSGIALFGWATGLRVHQRLAVGEFKADKVMNFNTGARPHLVDQHCLVVSEGGFSETGADGVATTGSICRTAAGVNFPGPPKNTWEVSILPEMLDTMTMLQRRDGESYEVSQADRTIAHELGHGLGIRHHGDNDKGYRPWRFEEVATGGFVVWADGVQVFVRDEKDGSIMLPPQLFPGRRAGETRLVWIGEQNGQMSGADVCIMRYVVAQAYRSLTEPGLLYYHRDGEIYGNRFCSARTGTGVNGTGHPPQPRYGAADAKRGDCAHRFVVSDHWEKRE